MVLDAVGGASAWANVLGQGKTQSDKEAQDDGNGEPPDGRHFPRRGRLLSMSFGWVLDQSGLFLFQCAQQSGL